MLAIADVISSSRRFWCRTMLIHFGMLTQNISTSTILIVCCALGTFSKIGRKIRQLSAMSRSEREWNAIYLLWSSKFANYYCWATKHKSYKFYCFSYYYSETTCEAFDRRLMMVRKLFEEPAFVEFGKYFINTYLKDQNRIEQWAMYARIRIGSVVNCNMAVERSYR